ncbi:MAG: glycosyltransferase family 2 protein [Rhodobacteraceae bacterium]|nr:glycosyltransferase family 2 protein [Paracoccaceae bacterium]
MMPKAGPDKVFTVVIPARNAEVFIEETLHSLAVQTLREFVAYIIDDGSTDLTASVVQAFINNSGDARFVLLEGPAKGVSAARNAGLELAKTRYVLFLDADDLLASDALERFTNKLDNTEDVAALGLILRIAQDGTPLVSHDNRDLVPVNNQLAGLIRKNYIVNGGALAIRTEVLKAREGYSEDLKFGEDWEFWCRVLLEGQLSVVSGGPVLSYRQISTGANNLANASVFAREVPCLERVSHNLDIQNRFGGDLQKMIRARRIDVFWSGVRSRFQYGAKSSAMLIALAGLFVYPDSFTRPDLALRFIKSLRG